MLDVPIGLDIYCRAIEEHAIVSITDAAGRLVYVNRRFCETSGYRADELLGQPHSIVNSGVHPPEFFQTLWQHLLAGRSWHGEICNRCKDGRLIWLSLTIVPVGGSDGSPLRFVATHTDITAQHEQLAKITKLATEQDELMRLAPFGIARLQHRCFTRVNDAFSRLLGYGEDELLGHSTRDIYCSAAQFEEIGHLAYEPLMQGEIVNFETELQRKDGSRLWVIAGTCSLNADDPMADTLYLIQDITAHRQLEEKLSEALLRAQAAERAKSLFLNSMTHELRTPLNGILGSGQIIESCLEDAELKSLSTLSNESARSLLRMVDMVLQYVSLDSAVPSVSPSGCHLAEIVAATLWNADGMARRFAVTLINALAQDKFDAILAVDQKMLADLLTQIVDNAIRYNRPGGSVTLTAGLEGGSICLAITDTGIGMSDDQLAQLAEPFTRFCQDGNRSGFGLGMALAHKLATLNGASLEFDSTPGTGTTVRISFPRQ